MKSLFTIAVLFIAFDAFAQSSPNTEYMPGTAMNPNWSEHTKLVNQFLEHHTTGNVQGFDNILSDKFIGNGPAYNETYTKEQYINEWKRNHDLFGNMKIWTVAYTFTVTPENQNKNLVGTWVQSWGTFSMTHLQTAKEVNINFHINSRIESGKIVQIFSFYDRYSMFEQLGYKVCPPDNGLPKEK